MKLRENGWKSREIEEKYDRLKYDVNLMAAGKIFDLEFEGFTSIVIKMKNTVDGSGYLAKSSTRDKEEIIYVEV